MYGMHGGLDGMHSNNVAYTVMVYMCHSNLPSWTAQVLAFFSEAVEYVPQFTGPSWKVCGGMYMCRPPCVVCMCGMYVFAWYIVMYINSGTHE